jgi:hypothetical protein
MFHADDAVWPSLANTAFTDAVAKKRGSHPQPKQSSPCSPAVHGGGGEKSIYPLAIALHVSGLVWPSAFSGARRWRRVRPHRWRRRAAWGGPASAAPRNLARAADPRPRPGLRARLRATRRGPPRGLKMGGERHRRGRGGEP